VEEAEKVLVLAVDVAEDLDRGRDGEKGGLG
jgi:hypothetical protein